ncbi:hypothetical protein HUU51_02920 [Candidatus Gracilibacteria bacterium]|nr:hypothetical protein [Candidatus Gracilibacteria bacterium]
MQHVHRVDDLIKAGQGFANSVQYNMFVLGYNELSTRTKNHFKEIFREFRLKYLLEKISKNLVNFRGPKNALNNYFSELKDDYPDFDLQYFYQTFPNSKVILDKILKK